MSQMYRSDQGIICGVCQGLAERLNLDVLLVRIVFLFSVLFLGVSFLVYFLIALSFPRKAKIGSVAQPKLLGVCARFGRRFDMDIGAVRLVFLTLLLFTGGSIILGYLLLYFILPTHSEMDAISPREKSS